MSQTTKTAIIAIGAFTALVALLFLLGMKLDKKDMPSILDIQNQKRREQHQYRAFEGQRLPD